MKLIKKNIEIKKKSDIHDLILKKYLKNKHKFAFFL